MFFPIVSIDSEENSHEESIKNLLSFNVFDVLQSMQRNYSLELLQFLNLVGLLLFYTLYSFLFHLVSYLTKEQKIAYHLHPCLLNLFDFLPRSHFEDEWMGEWKKYIGRVVKTMEATLLVCGEACLIPQDINDKLIASSSPQSNIQDRLQYFLATRPGPRLLEGSPVIKLLTATSSFLFKLLPILDKAANKNLFMLAYVILTLISEPTPSTRALIFYLLTASVFFASPQKGEMNVCTFPLFSLICFFLSGNSLKVYRLYLSICPTSFYYSEVSLLSCWPNFQPCLQNDHLHHRQPTLRSCFFLSISIVTHHVTLFSSL